jgi:hypothetical protein
MSRHAQFAVPSPQGVSVLPVSGSHACRGVQLVQKPLAHTPPPWHAVPQAPQLVGSERRSLHTPPHSVSGGGQAVVTAVLVSVLVVPTVVVRVAVAVPVTTVVRVGVAAVVVVRVTPQQLHALL